MITVLKFQPIFNKTNLVSYCPNIGNNSFFNDMHIYILDSEEVPSNVSPVIKKEYYDDSGVNNTRPVYQSSSVSIHEVSSMGHNNNQSQGQRDHGIASNLSVLASLAQSPHHNSSGHHQSLQYGNGEQNNRTHNLTNPTPNEKAIATAIAVVGNYPNHSPPPYANGEQANGSNFNNHNSSPTPVNRYSVGRHQQVCIYYQLLSTQ